MVSKAVRFDKSVKQRDSNVDVMGIEFHMELLTFSVINDTRQCVLFSLV